MYIQTLLEEIKTEEVRTQMGKNEKEQGVWTDELPMEIVKALGQEGEKWMVKVLNKWHPS